MKTIIKLALAKLKALIIRARGEKYIEIKFLGIQLLLIAHPGIHSTNIFILYLPVLRIDTAPSRFGINLLLLTWSYKILRNLFTKWEYVKQPEKTELKFCSIALYRRSESVPWRFPSAMFHG
jgi:hypothetical protein